MSKKSLATESVLRGVVVDSGRPQNVGKVKPSPAMAGNSNFVYVNPAYVGSVNSVNQRVTQEGVVIEQYWACSRWPYTQRVLAAVVGVLLGAVIGLAITMGLRGKEDSLIPGIFKASAPD